MLKNTALATVSLMALTALATPAFAADAAEKDNGEVRDIVVTATRQPTFVQDTPISITAVTSETLQARGVTSTSEISAIVPNASFKKAQGAFGPGVTAFIRGIGSSDTSLAGEAAVAFYIDDVYYPILLGSNFDLLDVDHVEVLRGPQGTLFGRNALAGAVNIVSKAPSLTKASGYVEATVGEFNRRDFRAGFNVPLSETLGVSVSAMSKQRTGYQRILDFRCQMNANGTPALAGNLPYSDTLLARTGNNSPSDCTIGHLGGDDVRAIRGSVLWHPADGVRLTVTGDYIDDRSDNVADTLISTDATKAAGQARFNALATYLGVAYDNRFVTGDNYTTYANYSDPIGAGVIVPGAANFYNGNPGHGGARYAPNIALTNWGVSGKLEIDLSSDILLTAIVGHRKMNDVHAFDTDGSPLVQEHTFANISESYTNAEVRLSGRHEVVDWVAGVFYFTGAGRNKAVTYSPWNGFYKYQNTTYDPTSKAVFANATIRPMDKLEVVLGARYSDDEKVVKYSNLIDPGGIGGDLIFNVTPTETRFDWRAGLNYHIDDDMMVYVSAATGAKSPGFNGRPIQSTQVGSFPGDRTRAYELGLKADLFGRKLRLNAVAFYTDYYQRIGGITGAEAQLGANGLPAAGNQVVIPNLAAGPSGTACRAQTSAEALAGPGVSCLARTFFVSTPGKAKGFELELEARPVSGLSVNASIGYSKFDSPDLAITTTNGRITDRLLALPEWTASAGVQYEIDAPMLGGSVTPRLDWFYQGSVPYSARRPEYFLPAYSVFNGRITYNNSDHDFSVALAVTNLFDKFYWRNFFIYQDIGFASANGQPAPPREWSLTLSKKF